MSEYTLKDFSTQNTVKVDKERRAHVLAVSTSLAITSSLRGEAYTINSDILTLTSDGDSWLIYLRNLEPQSLVVQTLTLTLGDSSGGQSGGRLFYSIGPSGGTLISDINAVTFPANLNTGSPNTLQGVFRKGDGTQDITGGLRQDLLIPTTGQRHSFEPNVIIPNGGQIAVGYKPPSGNTSMEVQLSGSVFVLNEDDV